MRIFYHTNQARDNPGDEQGQPGTILTFFSWPDVPKGRTGTGQIGTISFSIPEQSMDYWMERLARQNVLVAGPNTHFGEKVLTIFTPDGLTLELVAHQEVDQYKRNKQGDHLFSYYASVSHR